VAHRNGDEADRRGVRRVEHVPLHKPADRIGTVEYNYRQTFSSGCPHYFDRRGQIGVVPSPSILQIDHHGVDALHHFVGRGRSPAIKAVDWKPSGRVFRRRNRSARVGRPPKAMLWTEKSHQLDTRSL
jgi:hypothetical protein